MVLVLMSAPPSSRNLFDICSGDHFNSKRSTIIVMTTGSSLYGQCVRVLSHPSFHKKKKEGWILRSF
jgi:hypothetical protein